MPNTPQLASSGRAVSATDRGRRILMAADNGKRVGVVALAVSNRREQAAAVNALISDFGHLVVGRMGIPYKERGIHLIALLVDGDPYE